MTTTTEAAALLGAPEANISAVTDAANAGTVITATDGLVYWVDAGIVKMLKPPKGVVALSDSAAKHPIGAPADPDPLPAGWIDDSRLLALQAEETALVALGADVTGSTDVGLAGLRDALASIRYLIQWRTIELRSAYWSA